jgi:predicted nucleic acid-binding protein
VIVLDTSVLIGALSGVGQAAPLRRAIQRGERILIPALVLYEWTRGPRTPEELHAQEALFPSDQALPFTNQEAVTAAGLCKKVRRPRGREIDLAIAAHAVVHGAELWTLNLADFRDIPGLEVSEPA